MIIGFYGESGSGKTMLISKLIEVLESEQFSMGVIKHAPEGMDLDKKDTNVYMESKAELVSGISNKNSAIFLKTANLKEIIELIKLIKKLDLIIVEGFKSVEWLKKVRVGNIKEEKNTIFSYSDNFEDLVNYFRSELNIEKIRSNLPGFNCAECGHSTCRDMAEAIYNKDDQYENCKYWNPESLVSLIVDSQNIHMGRFAEDIVVNTILGLVASLKGGKKAKKIKIEISRS